MYRLWASGWSHDRRRRSWSSRSSIQPRETQLGVVDKTPVTQILAHRRSPGCPGSPAPYTHTLYRPPGRCVTPLIGATPGKGCRITTTRSACSRGTPHSVPLAYTHTVYSPWDAIHPSSPISTAPFQSGARRTWLAGACCTSVICGRSPGEDQAFCIVRAIKPTVSSGPRTRPRRRAGSGQR